MTQTFTKCTLQTITDMLDRYTQTLSSPIDSFIEEHILESEHFLIMLGGEKIGYFSIHKHSLLTQFYLEKAYRHLAQPIFFQVKRMQHVTRAFVPTCDEFFLSHALDEYREVERQAYFFQDMQHPVPEEKRNSEITLKLADLSDKEDILTNGQGFYDEKLDDHLANERIYIAKWKGATVGFGIIENGIILKDYASIGMQTVESYRQQGVGRNILLLLKEIVYSQQRIPIAGCWYYNHFSRRTLESAGMYTQTRLLQIHF